MQQVEVIGTLSTFKQRYPLKGIDPQVEEVADRIMVRVRESLGRTSKIHSQFASPENREIKEIVSEFTPQAEFKQSVPDLFHVPQPIYLEEQRDNKSRHGSESNKSSLMKSSVESVKLMKSQLNPHNLETPFSLYKNQRNPQSIQTRSTKTNQVVSPNGSEPMLLFDSLNKYLRDSYVSKPDPMQQQTVEKKNTPIQQRLIKTQQSTNKQIPVTKTQQSPAPKKSTSPVSKSKQPIPYSLRTAVKKPPPSRDQSKKSKSDIPQNSLQRTGTSQSITLFSPIQPKQQKAAVNTRMERTLKQTSMIKSASQHQGQMKKQLHIDTKILKQNIQSPLSGNAKASKVVKNKPNNVTPPPLITDGFNQITFSQNSQQQIQTPQISQMIQNVLPQSNTQSLSPKKQGYQNKLKKKNIDQPKTEYAKQLLQQLRQAKILKDDLLKKIQFDKL